MFSPAHKKSEHLSFLQGDKNKLKLAESLCGKMLVCPVYHLKKVWKQRKTASLAPSKEDLKLCN